MRPEEAAGYTERAIPLLSTMWMGNPKQYAQGSAIPP
jgi:hypothetical protein